MMCLFHLGQKVTAWVGRDRSDHLGQIQVITSHHSGQSYYLCRNNATLEIKHIVSECNSILASSSNTCRSAVGILLKFLRQVN